MSFGRWWFDSNWCQEADPEAKAVGDWFLCSWLGLGVGWPNQRQADDGTGGEEEPRAGQGSEHILLFGLPFLFACSGVKHLDVISVQPPLWACSCGSFKPLSPEAARMGRADGKSSRKEEMGNKNSGSLYTGRSACIPCSVFAAWDHPLPPRAGSFAQWDCRVLEFHIRLFPLLKVSLTPCCVKKFLLVLIKLEVCLSCFVLEVWAQEKSP